MTARLELVRALQRNETSMMRTLFPADARMARRFAIEVRRLGLARRPRIFTSQTEGEGPSAHNLRDMGFRPLYETAYFIRDTP